MGVRINTDMIANAQYMTGQCINFRNAIHFIAKQFNTNGPFTGVGRQDFNTIPTHPEGTSSKIYIIAFILNINQFAQDIISVIDIAYTQ